MYLKYVVCLTDGFIAPSAYSRVIVSSISQPVHIGI